MSQVSSVNISNVTALNDLTRFIQPFINQVGTALNNGLTVADNFRASVVQVSFPASANTNIQIKHNLPSTPIGYLVIQFGSAGIVYNGNSLVLSATFANLKCNLGGMTATLMFF